MSDTTAARRELLRLLLDRVERGAILPAEAPLLRPLIAADQADADARATAAHGANEEAWDWHDRASQARGTIGRVRKFLEQPDYDGNRMRENLLHLLDESPVPTAEQDATVRAEQAEELLDIAHETSNQAEAERAQAAQRADRAAAAALYEVAHMLQHIGSGTWADAVECVEARAMAYDRSGGQPPDTRRERITAALTAEHYRRAAEQIVASPEEHSAAMAEVVIAALDGPPCACAEPGSCLACRAGCQTPETHNWGCPCTTADGPAPTPDGTPTTDHGLLPGVRIVRRGEAGWVWECGHCVVWSGEHYTSEEIAAEYASTKHAAHIGETDDTPQRDDGRPTCRVMETRTCPDSYNGQPCGEERPCARFESDDPTPWVPGGTPAAVVDALRAGQSVTVAPPKPVIIRCSPLVNPACPGHTAPPFCERAASSPGPRTTYRLEADNEPIDRTVEAPATAEPEDCWRCKHPTHNPGECGDAGHRDGDEHCRCIEGAPSTTGSSE